MTTACAEGWAHWLGSRLVDAVHTKEGPSLWPDAYDYRADGTARLERQMKGRKPGDTDRGAGLWKDLHALIGDKGLAALFKAWGRTKVDPADPVPALGNMVNLVGRGEAAVAAWWKRAAPVFVSRDASSSGKTLAGLPGKGAQSFGAGDWLIRAVVDRKPAGRT